MAKQPGFKYWLLLLDCLTASTALFGSLRMVGDATLGSVLPLVPWLAVMLLAFRMNDLYKRHVVMSRRLHCQRLIKAHLLAGAVAVAFTALVNHQYFVVDGKRLLLVTLLVAFALSVVVRVLAFRSLLIALARRGISRTRVLIVGNRHCAGGVAESLRADHELGLEVVGFVADESFDSLVPHAAPASRMPHFGSLEDLHCAVERSGANEILIAIDDAPYERLIRVVETCLRTGCVVRIRSNLLKVVAEKLSVEFYSGVPVVMLAQNGAGKVYRAVKRAIDVTLAAAALVLLAPLFAAIAAGIAATSRGPILFRQQRIGKDGVPFEFVKFRSMRVDGDDSAHRRYVASFIAGADGGGEGVFKIRDDPRVFPFGRFIRRTSLDEVPQLFNVVRGEMSLVGPRPCLQYEWDRYADWHKRRLQILPGCTGLWQVFGRSSVTFEDMVILDLYYISNMSPWLDLRIVLRTVPVMLLGRGGL